MATCKGCGKRGWFLPVDRNGFCKICQIEVFPLIARHCQIVVDSNNIIIGSKNAATRLSRIGAAKRSLQYLIPFADRGVDTLTAHPKEVLKDYQTVRDEIIEQAIRDQVFAARQKAQDGVTDAGKLGGYAKAVETLMKLMDETDNVAPLEEAIFMLRIERDALKFDLIVRKAEVAEAKGQTKRAVELYVEAIMALRHDATPLDLQEDRLRHAEEKIISLGGMPPPPA